MIHFDCIVMYRPLVAKGGSATESGPLNPLSGHSAFSATSILPILPADITKIKNHKDAS